VTAAAVLALPDSPAVVWTARQTFLPRKKLRRGPLVDLPFENLRTGNGLYCVGWRNGKSWFVTPKQYLRLVDLSRESGCVVGKSKADDATENADDSPESLWTYSRAEPFNPSEWEMKSWGWWESPAEPQPPPGTFLGADRYSCVIGPDLWRDVNFIPSLKRKTLAKKENNLVKFAEEKRRLCAERKAQFKAWNKKLRESLGSHGNSHNGGRYHAENCPRCGASVFTTKRHVCLDCGYTLGELHYRPRTQDLPSYRDGLGWSPVQEITRVSNQRRRRHLTPEQFVAGLILRGQFENLTNAASLEKASGTYQILCEGWLPRDVAVFSNDSERAIAARAERLFNTVTEHQANGETLPQPNINEINHLKHHFAYLRNEIPSLRSDLCIN
jgi:ribosomal protein L37E